MYGGAGSGKSWFAAQKILLRVLNEAGHRFVCTRKVARTLRNSVWTLLLNLISVLDLREHFKINNTEMHLVFAPNGNEVLCIGLDDPEKIKSIAGVTGYWHEEPTELSPEDLTQLNLRLRGETRWYKQHILSFNPISHLHWLRQRFFESNIDGATVFKTTYKDNHFLDNEYVAELEALADIDESLHAVYALGEWGFLKGLIYRQPDTLAPWPGGFDNSAFGLDFGFNNPSALVRVDIRDRNAYITEELYEKGMTTNDLINRIQHVRDIHALPIWADAAEPDRIEEMRRAGFNVRPVDKGQGSVTAGIHLVQSFDLFARPNSPNVLREIGGYRWSEAKDGSMEEKPVPFDDHAMDAMRYALWMMHKRGRNIMPIKRSLIGV